MRLTPHEQERLMVHVAARLAADGVRPVADWVSARLAGRRVPAA